MRNHRVVVVVAGWGFGFLAGIALSLGFQVASILIAAGAGVRLAQPWAGLIGIGCTVLVVMAALAALRMAQDHQRQTPPDVSPLNTVDTTLPRSIING